MTPTALERLGTQIDDAFLIIGGIILLIEIAEAAFKPGRRWQTFGEMLVSASTQIPFIAVEIFIMTGAYAAFFILSDWIPWSIPVNLWGLALAVLVADLTYYWEHRIAHEVRLLWTQHAVHHSSRDLNIITGIRFGPFEGVWALIAHIPMVLIGFSAEAVIFGTLVVLAYQTWLHTELIGKLGPVEYVMNTPSHHRVHHGSDDKYLDRNYGGILIVWDRLFGTFQVEEERPRYGLTGDFDSKNPVRVWFSEIPGLWRDLKRSKDSADIRRSLFGRPGDGPKQGG